MWNHKKKDKLLKKETLSFALLSAKQDNIDNFNIFSVITEGEILFHWFLAGGHNLTDVL